MEQFQNKHITQALNIPAERFRSWIAMGYVKPSIQEATGRGVYNIFSRWDVHLIGLFVHLTKQGYGYRVAAHLVQGVRGIDESERTLADYIFIRFSKKGNPFDSADYTHSFDAVFLLHNEGDMHINMESGVIKHSEPAYCQTGCETEVSTGAIENFKKTNTMKRGRKVFKVENKKEVPYPKEALEADEFWTDAIHINFKRIKENVDLSLKKLDEG